MNKRYHSQRPNLSAGTLIVGNRTSSRGLGQFLKTVLAGLLCTFAATSSVEADTGPAAVTTTTGTKPRARALGIPFEGQPGRWNAITDVPQVEVGHTTLISGTGPLKVGQGPVRTGVTAIFPHGKSSRARSVAGVVSLNGNGELTGSHWLTESGFLESPILLTNTHSVGVAHDAVIAWGNRHFPPSGLLEEAFSLPVVAETYDGVLNDINGFHVKPEHVFAALDSARSGPVSEGNVGGGTGMICAEWKGGIGTSSRLVKLGTEQFTVGVLVQANYGRRPDARMAGVPIGLEIPESLPLFPTAKREKDGSIIIVVGTDAPLLPHQMQRLARRAGLGLGRTGSFASNSSGDLMIAFGPVQPAAAADGKEVWRVLPNEVLDPLLRATVQASEEAIANALVAAETMTGIDGNTAYAVPHNRLLEVMRKYGRLR
jgi:D-aminopeptidase